MDILKSLDLLYQAAKDRHQRSKGTESETYYRGQVVAYDRAYRTAQQNLQQAVEADGLTEGGVFQYSRR